MVEIGLLSVILSSYMSLFTLPLPLSTSSLPPFLSSSTVANRTQQTLPCVAAPSPLSLCSCFYYFLVCITTTYLLSSPVPDRIRQAIPRAPALGERQTEDSSTGADDQEAGREEAEAGEAGGEQAVGRLVAQAPFSQLGRTFFRCSEARVLLFPFRIFLTLPVLLSFLHISITSPSGRC